MGEAANAIPNATHTTAPEARTQRVLISPATRSPSTIVAARTDIGSRRLRRAAAGGACALGASRVLDTGRAEAVGDARTPTARLLDVRRHRHVLERHRPEVRPSDRVRQRRAVGRADL